MIDCLPPARFYFKRAPLKLCRLVYWPIFHCRPRKSLKKLQHPASWPPSSSFTCTDVRDTHFSFLARAHLTRASLVSSVARATSDAEGTAPWCWNRSELQRERQKNRHRGGKETDACSVYRLKKNTYSAKQGQIEIEPRPSETGLFTQCPLTRLSSLMCGGEKSTSR